MGKKKKSKRKNLWLPPKGASAYFSVASDARFKEKHPVGYVFLVVFGVALFMMPMLLFGWVTWEEEENGWLLLGLVGSMIFGVGLFNFVAILINQYLGHLVSLLSFLIGGVLIWVSLARVGIL